MSKKPSKSDPPIEALTSESARQRWELFHRAIAHAKESNNAMLDDCDGPGADRKSAGPLLSIVR